MLSTFLKSNHEESPDSGTREDLSRIISVIMAPTIADTPYQGVTEG